MALPLLTGASGLLVGVEVVDPPSWGTIGCQPAAFSTTEVFADRRGRYVVDVDPWELCDESSANATATLAATVQGRVVLVGMLRSWNPWVAWDASQCTPVRVAVRAHALGAEALIFAAAYLNQVPYAIVAAHESVGMPICMTWWSERNRINGQLSQQGQVLLQLHNTFRLYAPDDNPWPRHTVTSLQVYNPPLLLLRSTMAILTITMALQVYNPPELRWTFPAGQATYNPPELPPVVAEVAPHLPPPLTTYC